MIDSRHVYFYWGGPLLFGPPPQCISLGGPDPPTPAGIDAPDLESCDYSSEYEYWLRMCAVNRLKFLYCIKNYAFFG